MTKHLVLFVMGLSLLAGTARAQTPPIPVHVFTAPDDAGFITAESKARQQALATVTKQLAKASKVLTLTADATVTVEILSHRILPGTSAEMVGNRTYAIHQTELTAVLKYREVTQAFEVRVSSAGNGPEATEVLVYKVTAFVKDNATRLRQ